MIIRIVRMVFDPGYVDTFLALFEAKRTSIRAQPGCMHLELWRQPNQPNVFMTYSHWVDTDHLNAYRGTDLFAEVWKDTKKGFADRPQAWTMDRIDTVPYVEQ